MRTTSKQQHDAAYSILADLVRAGHVHHEALGRFEAGDLSVSCLHGGLVSFAEYAAGHKGFDGVIRECESLGCAPVGAIEALMFGHPCLAIPFASRLTSDNEIIGQQIAMGRFEAALAFADPCKLLGSELFAVEEGVLQPQLPGKAHMLSRMANTAALRGAAMMTRSEAERRYMENAHRQLGF